MEKSFDVVDAGAVVRVRVLELELWTFPAVKLLHGLPKIEFTSQVRAATYETYKKAISHIEYVADIASVSCHHRLCLNADLCVFDAKSAIFFEFI